jgi:predicted aconitase with swiveling domain
MIMEKITLRGRPVVEGVVEGEALVTGGSVTFFGTIDFATGTVMAPPDHELRGKSISGKILVFSAEVGSTAEPLGYYLLKRSGTGPKAILCNTPGQMPVVCSIIGNTPFVYNLDKDPVHHIKTGDHLRIDGDKGIVEVTRA